MRSPSRMVGFIDPVGTSFQSATADRTANSTTRTTSRGRTHSRQTFRASETGFSGAGFSGFSTFSDMDGPRLCGLLSEVLRPRRPDISFYAGPRPAVEGTRH